ncbi:hypothetical protein CRUP_018188, partial [Coryphaenoides rupestris]
AAAADVGPVAILTSSLCLAVAILIAFLVSVLRQPARRHKLTVLSTSLLCMCVLQCLATPAVAVTVAGARCSAAIYCPLSSSTWLACVPCGVVLHLLVVLEVVVCTNWRLVLDAGLCWLSTELTSPPPGNIVNRYFTSAPDPQNAVGPPTSPYTPNYHYYPQLLSWFEARHFCRVKHADLATVASVRDAQLLARAANGSAAWLGLWLAGPERWLWSDGSGSSVIGTFWQESEPNFLGGVENCVATTATGWNDIACDLLRTVVCQRDRSSSATLPPYYFDSSLRTWPDAQERCRSLGMDLPTVTRSSQNQDILSGVDGKSAWIGLFRDRWAWSDGSPSYLRFWLAGRPRNEHGCATVSSGNGGRWDGELCYVKRPFVCQGGPKSRVALIKVKMDSRAVVLGGAAARASFLQQVRETHILIAIDQQVATTMVL